MQSPSQFLSIAKEFLMGASQLTQSYFAEDAELKVETRNDIARLKSPFGTCVSDDDVKALVAKWKLPKMCYDVLKADVNSANLLFGTEWKESMAWMVEKWMVARVVIEVGASGTARTVALHRAEIANLQAQLAFQTREKNYCIAELDKLKVELATRATNLRSAELEKLKIELAHQTRAMTLRNAEFEKLTVELANQTRAKILYSVESTYFGRCNPSIAQTIQIIANIHDALVEEMTNLCDACPRSVSSAIEREVECYRPPSRGLELEQCLVVNNLAAFQRLQHKVFSPLKYPRPAEEQSEHNMQQGYYQPYLRADLFRALPTEAPFAAEEAFINGTMAATVCDAIERLRADHANVEEYVRTRGDEEALFVRELADLWEKMQVEMAYRPGELNERADKAMKLLRWFYGNLGRVKSDQLVPIITAALDTITSHRDCHRQRNLEALAAHQTAAEHARAMIAALGAFASDKARVVVDVARENAHQKSRRKDELQQAAAQIQDGYRRMLDVVVAQQSDAHRLSLCKAEEAASEEIRRTWQAAWQAEEELQTRLLKRAKDGDDFVGHFSAWYAACSEEMMQISEGNITLKRTLVARDTLKVRNLGSALLEQVVDQKQATLESLQVMQELYTQKQAKWRAFVNSQPFDEDSTSDTGSEDEDREQRRLVHQRLEADAERSRRAVEKRVRALEQQTQKLDERHAAIEGLLVAYEHQRQNVMGTKNEEKYAEKENDEAKDAKKEERCCKELEKGEDKEKVEVKDEKGEKEKDEKSEKEEDEKSEKEKVGAEYISEWVRSFFPRVPLICPGSSQNARNAESSTSSNDANKHDIESHASFTTESYIKV